MGLFLVSDQRVLLSVCVLGGLLVFQRVPPVGALPDHGLQNEAMHSSGLGALSVF